MTRLLALTALAAALVVPAAGAQTTIREYDVGVPAGHAKTSSRASARLCATRHPGGQMDSRDGLTIHPC
jgi:hypothetical protein